MELFLPSLDSFTLAHPADTMTFAKDFVVPVVESTISTSPKYLLILVTQ